MCVRIAGIHIAAPQLPHTARLAGLSLPFAAIEGSFLYSQDPNIPAVLDIHLLSLLVKLA
jgi:hypothetical protein